MVTPAPRGVVFWVLTIGMGLSLVCRPLGHHLEALKLDFLALPLASAPSAFFCAISPVNAYAESYLPLINVSAVV